MRTLENHNDWPVVKSVCKKIAENGFEAVLAGGCVRDAIMGRTPNDFDVATDATPDDLLRLFPDSESVGKHFGVIIVKIGGVAIEVATYRRDGEYKDGRHPETVQFSSQIEDAKRRDFTVNAIFFDPIKEKLIDHVGGISDIRAGVLATVGSAEQRFSEDYLRILRMVRFSSQLGFQVEQNTLNAALVLASKVSSISKERVRVEWEKMLNSKFSSKALQDLEYLNLIQPILGLKVNLTTWGKFLVQMAPTAKACEKTALLFWQNNTVLELNDSLKGLKESGQNLKAATGLLLSLQKIVELKNNLGAQLELISHQNIALVLWALNLRDEYFGQNQQWLDRLRNHIPSVLRNDKSGRLCEPILTGGALKLRGFLQGPEMGHQLKRAYQLQLELGLTNEEEIFAQLGEKE